MPYESYKSISLEIVEMTFRRAFSDHDVRNMEIRRLDGRPDNSAERVAYEFIHKIAKEKLPNTVEIRYPATWWDGLKEATCTKLHKQWWFRRLPTWMTNPFYGNVSYTVVKVGAEAFYDKLSLPHESHFMQVQIREQGSWNPLL